MSENLIEPLPPLVMIMTVEEGEAAFNQAKKMIQVTDENNQLTWIEDPNG